MAGAITGTALVLDDILVIGGLLVALAAAVWIDIRLVALVVGLALMIVGLVRAG